MRAALYLRVSTEEQSKEGYSLAAQEQSLRAYCTSQGWDVAGVYRDEGYSGKDLNRPALQALLRAVERKEIDIILVWRLDRLSRRQKDVLHLIEDVFAPNGVGFRSATEPFDTSTPAGMAMIGMLAVFAQLERATIVERVRMGLRQRLAQGKWTGIAPYGYRYGQNGVLEPDPDEAPWVREMFELCARGYSLSGIVQELHKRGAPRPFGRTRWNPSTVSWILHSRVYLGERRVRGTWMRLSHPPIVSSHLWQQAQHALGERTTDNRPDKTRKNRPSPYLLTGLIYCGDCGDRMYGHRFWHPSAGGTKVLRHYYVCNKVKRGRRECSVGYIRMERLDEAVVDRLAQDWERWMAESRIDPDGTLDRVQAAIRDVDRRIERLMEALEAGLDVQEVKSRLETLRAQRATLEEELRQAAAKPDPEEIASQIRDLRKLWPTLSHAERQQALRIIIRRIEVRSAADFTIRFW